jgi:uncharacterized protein (DUF2267 family)
MNFNQYIEKGQLIVSEVAEELGFPEDKDLAGRILRAVLHTLRERLTIQESFQMMAQFPMMLKAIYVDGWKYREKPVKIKNIGEFVRAVIHKDFPNGHHDINTAKDGENAIMAVLKVIRNHVSEGEIRDILQTLPADLRPLWGKPVLLL